MILRVLRLSVLFLGILSCKENRMDQVGSKIIIIDSLYVLHADYSIEDVRRYGVFPDSGIGIHPKLKKDKLEVLLDVAESGLNLNFPKGYYNRALRIYNRNNLTIRFEDAIFNGQIDIRNSENLTLKGNITSYSQFYIRDSNKIRIGELNLQSDTTKNVNGNRNFGCSIHAGTSNFRANKITITDLVSGPSYKFIKSAFSIHGHNNEPSNIIIDTVIVQSSDRHGAFITGTNINIDYIEIEKFGIGSSLFMAPMEGGTMGEQYNFSGLWIKNAYDSKIEKAVVNIANSKGKYSINFDIGEYFRPCIIDTVVIKGYNSLISERILNRTGVVTNNKYVEVIE